MSSTTTRLLELLSLLQTTREWPGPELASRLGISDRTVRRDIDRLRDMGYNIRATHGSDGGYRLQAGSELPPLLFDEDQALAVGIALQTVVGVGVKDAAERALLTIRQVMPSRLRHRLDAVDVVSVVSRSGAVSPRPVSPDVLVALSTAISFSEVFRFDYARRDGSERDDPVLPARRVEPHRIVTSHGHWYLLGWDLDRDDWRLFSADRITPRVPTGPRFAPRTVPGGDIEEFVAARFKGSDTNVWPCRGSVILDLPLREVLPFVGDGQAEALGDDRCVLTAGSWSWGSLAAALGRFEVPVEVIEPPELRDAFATLARRYALTATRG